MGLKGHKLIVYGSLAVVGGTIAVVWFGVPLGTLLLVGILLCCPIMMMGMNGHQAPSSGGNAAAQSSPDPGGRMRG